MKINRKQLRKIINEEKQKMLIGSRDGMDLVKLLYPILDEYTFNKGYSKEEFKKALIYYAKNM